MLFGGLFDIPSKEKRKIELESLITQENFWDNREKSEKTVKELSQIKEEIEEINNLIETIDSNIEILKDEDLDDEMISLIESEYEDLEKRLSIVETKALLNGKYDSNDALFEVHSGAGGTESCDWANMLFRMYTRYFDLKGYSYEIVDKHDLDVGIKSVSILVKGSHVYGYLKNEQGVHRLVRISPFDSNNRRHTSFASVSVEPIFENDDIDIDIQDTDVKIDVYRSSGAGGQSVNTTDSAVRITHIESGIVVTCQNERSQIQNKAKAMEILKSKLYKLEEDKKEKELEKIKGSSSSIDFGSQIRSYVMHPYSMVKDHRTNFETSNVDKVMDGYIDDFINANLRSEK